MIRPVIEVREYVPEGRTASFFARWFLGLDARGRQLIDDAVAHASRKPGRLQTRRVGRHGAAYRQWARIPDLFGRDGVKLILLLAGSTKHRQQKAISTAQELWREYKQSKRRGQ
jgi:putative component of toxin-antitoxin plasmid stabilization module